MRGNPGFRKDGGLRLIVVDASRARREIEAPSGEFRASDVAALDRLVLLEPSSGYNMLLRVPARKLFPGPGRYELVLEYASPLPSGGGRTGDYIEGITAVSSPLSVEVLP